MSDKLNIEQLISSKLGEAEIIPSQGAWKGIHRKLRWKQFLRFNPAQFNAYYLAGLIIAATGLIVILSTISASPVPADPVETVPDIQNEISPPQNLTEPEEPGSSKPEPAPVQESVLGTTQESGEPKPDVEFSDNSDSVSINQSSEENEVQMEIPSVILVETITENPAIENSPSDKPMTFFTCSAQSGCAPLDVQFHNQSVNAVSFLWSFGADVRSTASDPLYQFEEPGNYQVTLKTENQNGASSIYSLDIEVYPVPTADFAIEEGLEGINGRLSLNLLNYSSGGNSFGWCLLTEDLTSCGHWTSEEFQPPLHLTDLKNGADQMRLITTNEFNCVDTTIKPLPIRVESNDVKIKFATAFSPNPTGPGDGRFSPSERRIDLFHPIILEVPAEYNLKVYTKRGELVFATKDVYQGWDGYIQGERSAGGVYVWMLEGTWINGETFTMRGDVTLIWQDFW